MKSIMAAPRGRDTEPTRGSVECVRPAMDTGKVGTRDAVTIIRETCRTRHVEVTEKRIIKEIKEETNKHEETKEVTEKLKEVEVTTTGTQETKETKGETNEREGTTEVKTDTGIRRGRG